MSNQGSLQEVLDALDVTREAFFAAIFGKGSLPAARENPIPALLFLTKREWEELKRACKEAAGWRCEYIYPNGQRCKNCEGKDIYKGYIVVNGKRTRKKSTMHMHAGHEKLDPENPRPRLRCLCPKHHTSNDRQQEREGGYSGASRRGYRITTTDNLLADIDTSGITILEDDDGYHWCIDGTEMQGIKQTASGALGIAIHHLRCLWRQEQQVLRRTERELREAQTTISQLQEKLVLAESALQKQTFSDSSIQEEVLL
jgi:hypothetical protein